MASKLFGNDALKYLRLPLYRNLGVRCQSIGSASTHIDKRYELENAKRENVTRFAFDNSREAFRSKTSLQLLRALLVFRLCSINFLVQKNQQLMKLGQRMLGKGLFRKLMKATFYGHFVAGEDHEAIKPTISKLEQYGVGAILDYSVEEDLSEEDAQKAMGNDQVPIDQPKALADNPDDYKKYRSYKQFADRRKGVVSARTYFYSGEPECDKRLETFISCVDASGGSSSDGFAAIKVTALGRPQLLLKVSEILNQVQNFFDQLAKGSAIQNKIGSSIAKDHFFEGLDRLGVHINQDEADHIFDLIDKDKSGDIDVIEWHEFLTPQLQLSHLFKAKPTGNEKSGKPIISILDKDDLRQIQNMRDRLTKLAKHAEDRGVRLMIDAEQTYFQPAIRRLTLDLQRDINKDRPLVFNTYQCYLKDAYRHAQVDMELARREGFCFAAKVVRGAYMEQERLRAATLGYTDPIHSSYAATSDCFDKTMNSIIEQAAKGRANVMVASHNENSIRFAVQRMEELGLDPDSKRVFFGQLLGMADQISFTLGNAGYSVYKYVPYGPVEDVLPYLSRRAMENRGLLKGILKERAMLWEEFRRRGRENQLFPLNASL
ncbi:proline dehydrogenase 1, mitochondrial-like [Actinia tenebrosa]|uniref:Proline dehydrogenase n=1 Tax=Actinia tenebrosa TaxID=6105 RepID=A0A6P8H8X3_ACTTE|nr:proline dehydrogenase 1, mitochondrial-like [Actinia tenebrosa]